MSYATINVGAGLSFQISCEARDRAQRSANFTNLVHFVGLLDDGTEVEGTDRGAILAMGAQAIAWIVPDWIPQPPAPAGEVGVSRIINAALSSRSFSSALRREDC